MIVPPVSCSGAAYSGVRARPPSTVSVGSGAARVAFEQLGDAEIEQLHLSVRAHQHVRRLEIAVHDQVRVRVRHGGEHVEEQADARIDAERRSDRSTDRCARPPTYSSTRYGWPVRRDAGVDQVRDVRMA